VKIDKIPLTVNGKVDFGALPNPFVVKSRTIIPPSNETEETLLHCWKEVMKSDQISVDDDFFIIGGDSIVSIRLINLINTSFKINLSLVDFLSNRTIQKLAVAVQQNSQDIPDEKEKYLKELENFKNEILNTLT
jgi:surfactin family lipopeptide synthetase A